MIPRRWSEQIERFLFDSGSPVPVAVCRITLASGVLLAQASQTPDVSLFYTDAGVVPNAVLSRLQRDDLWSLLHLGGSGSFAMALHGLLLLSALGLALGFRTTLSCAVLFVTFVSFRHRNPLVTNAGDQVVCLALFWLLFADSGRVLSLDRRLGRKSPPRPWRGCLALRQLQLQLCLIYALAFLHKLGDPAWRAGTKMATLVQDTAIWFVPLDWAAQSPRLCAAATWGTLAFEALFPLLVWWPACRRPLILAGLVFHGLIGLFLGIPAFSLAMAALLLLFWPSRFLRERLS